MKSEFMKENKDDNKREIKRMEKDNIKCLTSLQFTILIECRLNFKN